MFYVSLKWKSAAANLKIQDNWSRLLLKSFNDAQNIWHEGVLQEFPGSTWDEIRVKFVEQFDKPEQRLKSICANVMDRKLKRIQERITNGVLNLGATNTWR
ncbi:hypothetical protein INT45_013760 [Circinella minor]|uniref:Retrotransposon gag domain-containing protein n=1 Tax=Circinella minor TaxID=1195481 RepID=A0A8H7RUS9_9FUNG|nr:hypothetical protein INT45_013760 [Circinella minor]